MYIPLSADEVLGLLCPLSFFLTLEVEEGAGAEGETLATDDAGRDDRVCRLSVSADGPGVGVRGGGGVCLPAVLTR